MATYTRKLENVYQAITRLNEVAAQAKTHGIADVSLVTKEINRLVKGIETGEFRARMPYLETLAK